MGAKVTIFFFWLTVDFGYVIEGNISKKQEYF